MELMTISTLSKEFEVSTRNLRYYEQLGLINSQKKEGYSYRCYDAQAVRTLQQILLLRKLRIPLKHIDRILHSTELKELAAVFQENYRALDNQIMALSVIRGLLGSFITRLDSRAKLGLRLDLLEDSDLIKIAESLSLSKITIKEEHSMEELNQANQVLEQLKNARIVYLPPATVAASHYVGDNPEDVAGDRLAEFVKATGLQRKKPDLRCYGFNNPCPQTPGETYGYEFWVTIPEDMEVPAPLTKKQFAGGLYAAHCIPMGEFHQWEPFYIWATNHKDYEIDPREPISMGGTMEEHLNIYSYYENNETDIHQLDLLIPIKPREN